MQVYPVKTERDGAEEYEPCPARNQGDINYVETTFSGGCFFYYPETIGCDPNEDKNEND